MASSLKHAHVRPLVVVLAVAIAAQMAMSSDKNLSPALPIGLEIGDNQRRIFDQRQLIVSIKLSLDNTTMRPKKQDDLSQTLSHK